MTHVEETVEIRANPDAVFDLIVKVEDFPQYVDYLKKVASTGPDRYRWFVVISRFEFRWDSVITECVRPQRIAWKSFRGINNSGSFTLQPSPGGTLVRLAMDFSLRNRFVNRALFPVLTRMTQVVAANTVKRVKAAIETKAGA